MYLFQPSPSDIKLVFFQLFANNRNPKWCMNALCTAAPFETEGVRDLERLLRYHLRFRRGDELQALVGSEKHSFYYK